MHKYTTSINEKNYSLSQSNPSKTLAIDCRDRGRVNLEAEVGKRKEVVEEIKGFLEAPVHLVFDQPIHLFLRPGVTVVIIDVRQRIDDFSADRPRRPMIAYR